MTRSWRSDIRIELAEERRCVPAIREAKDFFARRQPVSPPTERGALTCVFGESEFPKTLRQHGVFGVGRDLGDGVDILRRPKAGDGGIRKKEAGRAAAKKHQVVEDRTQHPGCGLELLPVRIAHALGGEAGQ